MSFFRSLLIATLGIALTAEVALAADFTDVLDAADDFDDYLPETYDAFDIAIEPAFRYSAYSAIIARDAPCVTDAANLVGSDALRANEAGRVIVDGSKCANETLSTIDQLELAGSSMSIDTKLRIGLYKDLELVAVIPYVLSQKSNVRNSENIRNGTNKSSIYVSNDVMDADVGRLFKAGMSKEDKIKALRDSYSIRYFNVSDDFDPNREVERSGLADPTIGIRWGLFNDHRDDTGATFNLSLMYTMPIAPVKKIDNKAVGMGMHELNLGIHASKQFGIIEPYFGFDLIGRLLADKSPFKLAPDRVKGNIGQSVKVPQMTGKITLGTEIVFYEKPKDEVRYSLDIRGEFGYNSIGITYSPLLDQFGQSSCQGKSVDEIVNAVDNNGNVKDYDALGCAWIMQQPGNASESYGATPDPNDPNDASQRYPYTASDYKHYIGNFAYDGGVTSSDYGTLAGRVALLIRPTKYVQIAGFGSIETRTNHIMNEAILGRSLDETKKTDNTVIDGSGDGIVSIDRESTKYERNPVHNLSSETYGRRLHVIDMLKWEAGVSISVFY